MKTVLVLGLMLGSCVSGCVIPMDAPSAAKAKPPVDSEACEMSQPPIIALTKAHKFVRSETCGLAIRLGRAACDSGAMEGCDLLGVILLDARCAEPRFLDARGACHGPPPSRT
jgi:hypothetical protein